MSKIFPHCIESKQYPQTYYSSAGVITNRRRNNYALQRAAAPQKNRIFEKKLTVPKIAAQCQKNPILYLDTLQDHSISLCITRKHHLNTIPKLHPILLH